MTKNKIPSKASYLSNCDFLNKLALRHVKEIPSFSKITLELSSLNIFSAVEKINQNDYNSEDKIKLFLILYIFKLCQPVIHSGAYAKSKETDEGLLLRINFSKKKEISNLLTILFTENWNKLILRSLTSPDKKIFSFKVTVGTFFGADRFLGRNITEVDSNKLNLTCRFAFQNKNLKNQVLSIKLIKNITPFWMSC